MQIKKWNHAIFISFLSTQQDHQKNLQQFNQAIIKMGVYIEDNMVAIGKPKLFILILICLKLLTKMWRMQLNLS